MSSGAILAANTEFSNDNLRCGSISPTETELRVRSGGGSPNVRSPRCRFTSVHAANLSMRRPMRSGNRKMMRFAVSVSALSRTPTNRLTPPPTSVRRKYHPFLTLLLWTLSVRSPTSRPHRMSEEHRGFPFGHCRGHPRSNTLLSRVARSGIFYT